MPNYQDKRSWTVGKFTLDVYPYIAPPENLFDNPAIQYGADFKVTFAREGAFKNNVGLLQLIFPRTQIFPHTLVGAWNVDKQRVAASNITLGGALYSEDGVTVGVHSEPYQGEQTRFHSNAQCWLIDTPRELSSAFAGSKFTGQTSTKFAEYVVDFGSKDGVIYNPGVVWGYSVTQEDANPANFGMSIVEPKECLLKDTNEHLDAIARFLNSTRATIKSLVS